jgi:ubiquinone biosynthesis UbiH/UbiF/VisC/COQ6 family hydroxylase
MTNFDVIIIGAGPVGLAFATTLARSRLNVALVERQPRAAIEDPAFDGREIALTHDSVRTLRGCGIWANIPAVEVSLLRTARVWNGASPFSMHIEKAGTPCENLGYLVSNHLIRRAAWATASAVPNLSIFFESRVTSLAPVDDSAAMRVTLQDGTSLRAALTVSADSRFSETRRAVGISSTSQDFGRTMLVCRMRHEEPHDGVAWEWFDHGQTLALLPLNGGTSSSVVVTVDDEQARRLCAMDETDFNADIRRRFCGRLGEMHLCSSRHAYPLIGVYANRFVSERHALIGDAAVGMHPVTAHGFNLGLRGQATLAREVLEAAAHVTDQGTDPGAAPGLARYERAHRRATWPLYTATNALVRLYTAEAPPLRVARHALLRVADRFTPFRHAVAALL